MRILQPSDLNSAIAKKHDELLTEQLSSQSPISLRDKFRKVRRATCVYHAMTDLIHIFGVRVGLARLPWPYYLPSTT